MRRSKVRFVCAAVMFAVVIGSISHGQPVVQPLPGIGQPGKQKGKKDDKYERPKGEENIPISLPYDRDARKQLEAARDYLQFEVVPYNTVCPLLQSILEARSDSFFNTTQQVGGQPGVHRISVKTEANRIIAEFKKDGLEFYQQAYGQTASALLDDAIKANYDLAMLADLSQRFFHTKAGAEATILLGTLYLERGNYLEAAFAFERVLGRSDVKDVITPRTLFKACIAFKRSGDPKHTPLLEKNLEALRKATSRDGLVIGRRTYTFEQLQAEIDRKLELIRPTSTVGEWAMQRGNPSRSGTVEGGPPFLDPIFRSPMTYPVDDDEEAHNWIKTELGRLFSRDGRMQSHGVPLPGFFPITTADQVIFRSYVGVTAVATRDQVVNGRVVRAGDVRWATKTTVGLHQMLTKGPSDIDMAQNADGWWKNYAPQPGVSSVIYENPLIGTVAHDGTNVYFIDDVAIPPPPTLANPNFGGINPGGLIPLSGELGEAVRAGRLVAVDLKSGLMRWELGRFPTLRDLGDSQPAPPPLPPFLTEEEADQTTDAFQLCLDAIFLSTPLPLNGKLYVLIEQAGVIRLLCLDPKNLLPVPGFPHMKVPALVWSQKLGRPNNNLPDDSIRRFQGCTLTASEGIIICPTNSGAIVAVDIMSRSLLWAHAYREIDPTTRPQTQIDPQTGRPRLVMQLPADRWRSGGPIIVGGRVITTAYDSNFLDCLDLRSGRLLWRVQRDSNDMYVGGVIKDRVIVVGRNQLRGYHLMGEENQEPKVAFAPVSIPTPTGHGIGGKDVFYVPVRQDNAGKDTIPPAEIWAINVETGTVVSKTAARKRNDDKTRELAMFGIGNLVFQDGMVFAQSAWEVACYPQLEQKRAAMDRLLAANPNDPVGLLTRGELLLDEGKLAQAIADFKAAQKHGLPPEKEPLLREKLYIAYTEQIRKDFGTAEPILEEYKTLCVVDTNGELEPAEKRAREEETERRQRLFLYLLAKGREGQGRLGEAFDHYLELSRLGESKSLLDMPDEPNVRMRPDVWARGRIEGMIRRATDASARKSLEDRVQKEWQAVKENPNDLARLRDFVAVFGPYFSIGADAQFLLADKLLETNNEADAREAQTYLSQLRVAAEEPEVRARATEALARLMVQNLLMEDAVGLYLQLGKEYADVVVRDGKTGAQFMRTLLTDKRLFPYLEPSRYPMPTRVKAEQTTAIPSANNNAQFEIEPGGELFPMYKRYRFVFDQYVSRNGTWTLRGFDRATGVEKCSFSGLHPPQFRNYNPGTMQFSKFVQGSGQLLLVQLGSWVYCLDLAEKKERWQKNLLGDPIPGQANPIIMQDAGLNGEVVIKSSDGRRTLLTLGKSAVLQPGYCALLTYDGLEVVEPLSRRVLWTRRGLPEGAHLYGDARYMVVVENGENKKPSKATLLRATDGMPVEGSPDSGKVLAGATSFTINGRTALLAEGTGDEPRVLRLYDLATGKDIWKRQYDSKAVPIRAITGNWIGYIKSTGEAEVIDARTGKVTATLQIDAKNLEEDLKPCNQAQLIADADRFYLFLDRDPSAGSTNDTQRVPIYNNTIRTHQVNGPVYAFDRVNGKRLWHYGNGLFENQLLILEQFADLPVIIATSPVLQRNKQGARYHTPVVVIEKERGRLIFDRAAMNNNPFQNLQVNFKNGTIELNRFDMRVSITPDDKPREGEE